MWWSGIAVPSISLLGATAVCSTSIILQLRRIFVYHPLSCWIVGLSESALIKIYLFTGLLCCLSCLYKVFKVVFNANCAECVASFFFYIVCSKTIQFLTFIALQQKFTYLCLMYIGKNKSRRKGLFQINFNFPISTTLTWISVSFHWRFFNCTNVQAIFTTPIVRQSVVTDFSWLVTAFSGGIKYGFRCT